MLFFVVLRVNVGTECPFRPANRKRVRLPASTSGGFEQFNPKVQAARRDWAQMPTVWASRPLRHKAAARIDAGPGRVPPLASAGLWASDPAVMRPAAKCAGRPVGPPHGRGKDI